MLGKGRTLAASQLEREMRVPAGQHGINRADTVEARAHEQTIEAFGQEGNEPCGGRELRWQGVVQQCSYYGAQLKKKEFEKKNQKVSFAENEEKITGQCSHAAKSEVVPKSLLQEQIDQARFSF